MEGSTVLVDGLAVGAGRNGTVQALSTSAAATATQVATKPRRAPRWADRSLEGAPAGRWGADVMGSPIAG
ncbi:hypothetical protein [Arthrobacter sp. YN]|uniref:hypothetical protein n=1 Tax=Arthrobacter sp. YN TaxID=2020486 RepID=UPI001E588BB5|nr:hypothetical protein [Arthrobacter sp. YN]